MILPWIFQLFFGLIGLALSIIAVAAVCYVAFVLLGELMEEDDNG